MYQNHTRNKPMAAQTVNISLPEELLDKVDRAAKAEFISRSDYIRQALAGKLKADEVRERAESWRLLETIADEASANAERLGLAGDEDIVQAVKNMRRQAQDSK
jgi:metal-responsive CopG/Arc/MetJ family transcriptional regulator